MDAKEIFAQRLNDAMSRYDITINELSRRTGINVGTISHYKNATYEPRQTNIYLIAKALNVSPGWLLGFDSDDLERRAATMDIYTHLSDEHLQQATDKLKEFFK